MCVLDAKWDLSNAKCDDQVFPGGFLCSERELVEKMEKKAGAVCEHCTTGAGSADV